jgi:hypothetical protein
MAIFNSYAKLPEANTADGRNLASDCRWAKSPYNL